MTRFINNLKSESTPEALNIKFFTIESPNGEPIINSYILVNGKMYRVRSEMLVFDKRLEKIYAEKKDKATQYGIKANIPGGSAEPNRSLKEQAILEVAEEAEISVKNVEYTGVKIIKAYEKYPKWQIEVLWPKGYRYEGCCTFIFTAIIDKKIQRVKTASDDDHENAKKYKFYKPEELGLDDIRLNIIKQYKE